MKPRQRVTAICIKENKVLMVRDDAVDFFSTPGGSVEGDEDHEKTLRRELLEEVEKGSVVVAVACKEQLFPALKKSGMVSLGL